jgi:hypothetical protein
MRGFFKVLELIVGYMGTEYSAYYADVKAELYKLFDTPSILILVDVLGQRPVFVKIDAVAAGAAMLTRLPLASARINRSHAPKRFQLLAAARHAKQKSWGHGDRT